MYRYLVVAKCSLVGIPAPNLVLLILLNLISFRNSICYFLLLTSKSPWRIDKWHTLTMYSGEHIEESKNYFKHRTTNSIRKLGYCCVRESESISNHILISLHNPCTFTWWILKKNSINWWSERENLCRLSWKPVSVHIFAMVSSKVYSSRLTIR